MSVVYRENEISQNFSVNEFLQIVTFNIGNETFGADILKVKEIIRMMPITKVPNTPDYLEGVINLRGKVIPIINIRSRFSMPRIEPTTKTRIVIIDLNAKYIGFIVDVVNEVLRIPKSSFEIPSELIAGIDLKYITSVGIWNKKMIILLDLCKILTTSEQSILHENI